MLLEGLSASGFWRLDKLRKEKWTGFWKEAKVVGGNECP
jgi:hypothetical protein